MFSINDTAENYIEIHTKEINDIQKEIEKLECDIAILKNAQRMHQDILDVIEKHLE